MKLQSRLTLPVFAVVVFSMAASVFGAIYLVRGTFGTAMREQGEQFGRIAETVLRGRTRGLTVVARQLADAGPGFRSRALAQRKSAQLDLALTIKPGGKASVAFGPAVEPSDLAALGLGKIPSPLLLHTDNGLAIGGAAPLRGGGYAVVARLADQEFADALQELLRTEVSIGIEGHEEVKSADTSPDFPDFLPTTLDLATPGGNTVRLSILMPVRQANTTIQKALVSVVVGGLLLLALTMGFHYWTVVRVTHPILDLTDASGRIARGDLDATLPADAPAELGILVRQFNDMATSLKQAREKLVHSAKLSSVGEMVAGISHELNNPLTGIIGHAEYLAGKVGPGGPGREEIDVMLNEAKRMKRTLAQLRGLIKPADAEKAVIDLNRLVEEVFVLVKHDASKADIHCTTRPSPVPVSIHAVPDQVRQVLLNLALNAVQALPRGGIITAETALVADGPVRTARVTITDDGIGMTPDQVTRIFEPFYSGKPGNLGLGLAICREIAERHGGRMLVASEPGKGTSVTLSLPALGDS